jgi:antitoxin component of RelBE/YafQ-DinJ toxin-antitoxin module
LYVQSESFLFLNNYSNIKALPTDLHNPSNNASTTRDVENRPDNLQLLSDLKSD